MDALTGPDLEAAERFLATHLPSLALSSRCLLVVGECRVDYQGRAVSQLALGDRIVLVKPDGSLLIHGPEGFKPLNWQPPGCAYAARRDGAELVLEAVRRKPAEAVRVAFVRLDLVAAPRIAAAAPLNVQGTEFNIRDALRSRPEWVEPGFQPWAKERLTERGPMDLYGEDANGRRVVVEVKRTRAGIAEATQLWRYVEKERAKRGVPVRGILVAPACSDRALQLLGEHGLEFKPLRWEEILPTMSRPARSETSLMEFGAVRAQITKD